MWLTKSISVIPSELHVNSHVSQSFHACYYVSNIKMPITMKKIQCPWKLI